MDCKHCNKTSAKGFALGPLIILKYINNLVNQPTSSRQIFVDYVELITSSMKLDSRAVVITPLCSVVISKVGSIYKCQHLSIGDHPTFQLPFFEEDDNESIKSRTWA